jgi:hypothetical protein
MPDELCTSNPNNRQTIPEPPAEHRRLIGPAEVAQMRERRRQLQALREMIADREGRHDGQ